MMHFRFRYSKKVKNACFQKFLKKMDKKNREMTGRSRREHWSYLEWHKIWTLENQSNLLFNKNRCAMLAEIPTFPCLMKTIFIIYLYLVAWITELHNQFTKKRFQPNDNTIINDNLHFVDFDQSFFIQYSITVCLVALQICFQQNPFIMLQEIVWDQISVLVLGTETNNDAKVQFQCPYQSQKKILKPKLFFSLIFSHFWGNTSLYKLENKSRSAKLI